MSVRFDAWMAGFGSARAAVLGRLWGAIAREALPGIVGRRLHGDVLVVSMRDGRTLSGPADAAAMFAPPPAGLTISVGGVGFCDPASLARALGWPSRLCAELADSVANVALARSAVPVQVSGSGGGAGAVRCAGRVPGSARALADVEARVVDGHPLHPLCRTRTGMSAAEQVRYAPEHRPTVSLDMVAVSADRWRGVGLWPWRAGNDFLLPVHPWQREHVLGGGLPSVARMDALPLMSLRTLAVDDMWHVKTAVDVQMTSAIRTVSAAALVNGPALSKLVAQIADVEVLDEKASGALVVDGAPSRHFAAVARRAPVVGVGESVAPMAALCAGEKPLIVEFAAGNPVGWMGALARVLARPLAELASCGVALEAHGQNTLVVTVDGWPVRACYRDFGGVRVHAGMLAARGIRCPDLAGDVPTAHTSQLRTKFLASAGVMLAEAVTVLSRFTGVSTQALWRPIAQAWGDFPSMVRGAWPVKATTAMRMAHDPLDEVWVWIPNPLENL